LYRCIKSSKIIIVEEIKYNKPPEELILQGVYYISTLNPIEE
jgi:hypothetical protein